MDIDDSSIRIVYGIATWTARALGFVACGFFLLFILGEGVPNILRGQGAELLPFLPLLGAAILGYILAWFAELPGGVLLLAGGLAMSAYHLGRGGIADLQAALIYGLPFCILGLLFLLSWQLKKHRI